MQAILSSVACPALQRFSTLSHKRPHFQKNVVKHKMCVSIFSITFVRNIFHSKENWARYDKECILVLMESTLLSCPSLIKLEFSREMLENLQISNFTKIWPVEAELFHADRRTDGRTGGRADWQTWKAISRFSQFCEKRLKTKFLLIWCFSDRAS